MADMGQYAAGIYRAQRVFVPGVQSAVRSLLCGHGSDQTRDEFGQMDLVCDRVSDAVRLCGEFVHLSDRHTAVRRRFWDRYGGGSGCDGCIFVSAVSAGSEKQASEEAGRGLTGYTADDYTEGSKT